VGLTSDMGAYADIPRGTYRWYVGLYNDYWERVLTHIDESDRGAIIEVFSRLRDEHTINWNRNYLYEFRHEDKEQVKSLIENKIRTTDRFDVLKACLYLSRHMEKDYVVDDHVIRKVPELKAFIDGYTEPDLTPLQKTILHMARGEHSLLDWELLEIGNRGFKGLMARRAIERSGDKYHPTNLNAIELNLTYECSLKCYNCDRMCGKAESDDRMTVDQVRRFIEESKALGREWERVRVTGGEPTTHPDIMEIVGMLLDYRNASLPETSYVQVVSNGYGDAARIVSDIRSKYTQKVVPDTAASALVRCSNKRNKVVLHSPVNMAPVDDDTLKGKDFRNGCWVTEQSGMALTRHGYYCCGVGAAIDRVMGFDIGIKSLKDVSMGRFVAQRAKLCALCGRFGDLSISQEYYGPTWVIEEKTSPTWEKAFEAYRLNRPPPIVC